MEPTFRPLAPNNTLMDGPHFSAPGPSAAMNGPHFLALAPNNTLDIGPHLLAPDPQNAS